MSDKEDAVTDEPTFLSHFAVERRVVQLYWPSCASLPAGETPDGWIFLRVRVMMDVWLHLLLFVMFRSCIT